MKLGHSDDINDFMLRSVIPYILDYGEDGYLPNQDGEGGVVYAQAVKIAEQIGVVVERQPIISKGGM